MKSLHMTIGVLLLMTGLALNAQQANRACSRQSSGQSSGQSPAWRRGIPVVCKPSLPGSQRLLNDLPRNDDGASYVSFDVPGDANGTSPAGINDWGTVTGSYLDAAFMSHGFVRDPLGNITSFDVPGDGGGTIASAINDAGTIIGGWCPDTTYTDCPGFLRDFWGHITSFDPSGEYYGTVPEAISPDGAVTGFYFDVNFIAHGFVRSRDGSITEFDPPGSISTFAYAIGADGAIAGSYQDASGNFHGFLRSRGGNISTFDVPGYTDTGIGFFSGHPITMNPEGDIAGGYLQTPDPEVFDGFLRHRDGTYDTFYAADYPPCCIWTFPEAINADRTIAGTLNDGSSIFYGFVRTSDGDVTLFEAPGAGTGAFQGTEVVGMTPYRVIVGFYTDSNGLNHGYLRIPF
jgi:uncharacterized membrane protein